LLGRGPPLRPDADPVHGRSRALGRGPHPARAGDPRAPDRGRERLLLRRAGRAHEADCGLLLDVNNIYVNAINHRYDARGFLRALPAERVCYFHVAGHYVEAPDLRVDTHGADVCGDVWMLLDEAYALFGPVPTLLERDFNFPPLATLVGEVAGIRDRQRRQAPRSAAAGA
jgi:uncharacterized protein (UPF0276 family)